MRPAVGQDTVRHRPRRVGRHAGAPDGWFAPTYKILADAWRECVRTLHPLIAKLREIGPVTTAELARTLERDYKNVHVDVAALSEWLAVQREEDGRFCVPWTAIIVDMKLPARLAA